jgi:hypothetical protein
MKLSSIISGLFWRMRPVMKWIDETFTNEDAIKKVNGDHYYKWRDQIYQGMVFLSNINGVGSNLINPSEINHSAIYFGKGLKTAIMSRVKELEEKLGGMSDRDEVLKVEAKIDRLIETVTKYEVRDDICYVIEAVGRGVIPTNLVKFITSKDLIRIYMPNFGAKVMRDAAFNAIDDLGLGYDFGFSHDDKTKYCFEVVADAYEKASGEKLKRVEYKFFGLKLFETFLSETFSEDPKRWRCVIDSQNES